MIFRRSSLRNENLHNVCLFSDDMYYGGLDLEACEKYTWALFSHLDIFVVYIFPIAFRQFQNWTIPETFTQVPEE